MFNNRFNSSKNDPLIEAVKAARADGDARRLAESMANDLFGVYSRKAVVREDLAAYDAALEELYAELKEGKTDNKKIDIHHKGEYKASTTWSKNTKEAKAKWLEKNKDHDPKDVKTSYAPLKEGKPLSPKQQKMASLAGDPKKIDAADLKALRHGAKINEKKTWEEGITITPTKPNSDPSVQGGSDVTDSGKPSVSPTAPQASSSPDYSSMKTRSGHTAPINELTKPTGKTAMMALHRAERSDDETNDYTRTNRLFNWKQKHLPGKSARNQKDTGKAELPDYSEKDSGYVPTVKKSGKLMKSTEKATKAEIKSRLGKHTKPKHLPEESLEEATRKHFIKHAADIAKISDPEERNKAATSAAKIYAGLNPRFDHAKFHKAAGSTAHEAPKKMEESSYSATAAAAGEDIGKKGKMFSKIANKVSRKTGSLVRGKKVAGAMLAKLRAKHKNKQRPVSEDSSFKSAQVTESKKLGLGKSVNEQSSLTATREMPKTTSAPPVRSPITPMSASAPEVRSPNAPDPAPAAGKRSFLGRLSDKIGSSISQFKDKISSLRGQPKPSTTNFNFGKTVPDTTMRFAGALEPKVASVAPRVALGRALSAAAGPEGVAIGAAAPYAATAMQKSHQQAHSSFTGGHTETPTDRKSFERMRQMSVPKPAAATPPAPGTAKPAAPPAKPSTPVKQTFSQAYRAARASAKPGEDPNKVQFKWTNKAGKEGTYQAAATKKDYVAPSKQIKTNVSSPETKTTPETQTPAPAAQTPGPSTASVKVDNDRVKTLGDLRNTNQRIKDIKFPLRGVDTNKAVSDNMSPEKSPAKEWGPSKNLFSNISAGVGDKIKGSAAPPDVPYFARPKVTTPTEPSVTPPKDAETPASKYPQTRIGGQMAIQDLANKASETPSSMTVNKNTSTDDIVKALSGKKQTNESEDKTDTQTQPREISKYDFTKIMPDMTQDEIKKSKEITTTPKIRNINMRESVQVGSNKYRIV